MAKNIQINLTFRADTTAAKKEMDSLQSSLTKLASTPLNTASTNVLKSNLQAAQKEAVELKVALDRATNVDTGKLNFGKFQQELKANGKTLQDYSTTLRKIGPAGTQVFEELSRAVQNSETPIISLQGKMAKLASTLGNTIRWTLSSSAIQGFTQMISGTLDYAKELNESLTNIRIVTGKSEEQMAKFAKSANQAAKSLSATTTEYTNASLIYFQQGLRDKEVLQRAETTLKLANVVGESAETVSEWMTAIWNNFDNGSKPLEYYGDVLAALGAETASSADEIAQGLEKFSAIADTVGLSYEYAASALATVTAETRQSADVVGTAFKTIFSRMESLELGETLDDGTTLGKYSAAMQKVGVEIKDANGQMRDMDNILSDLGKQWQFLNKDQQIALAQSVAGIRQYNQFIGLMSNWNVMEENLKTTKEATGELEYQQQIYASGMEGASARVQAALEKVKNSFLDENDLLPFMNAAEKLLEFVGDLVDAFGGLPGILTLVSSILLKTFSGKVANSLRGMTSNIAMTVNAISGKTKAEKDEAVDTLSKDAKASLGKYGGEENLLRAKYLEEDIKLTEILRQKEENLTAEQKEQLSLMKQIIEAKREIALGQAQQVDQANKTADKLEQVNLPLAVRNKDDKTDIDKINKEKSVAKQSQERNKENIVEKNSSQKKQSQIENQSEQQLKKYGVSNKDIDQIYSAAATETQITSYGDKIEGLAPKNNFGKMGSDNHVKETVKLAEALRNSGVATPDDLTMIDSIQTTIQNKANENKDLELAIKEDKDKADKLKIKKKTEPNSFTEKDNENLKKYNNNISKNTTKIKENRNIMKQQSQQLQQTGKNMKVLDNTTDKISKKYDKAGKEIKDFGKEIGKASDATYEQQKSMKDAEDSANNYKEGLNELGKTDWANKLVSGFQMAASAASGIMMITGAVDSLSSAIAEGEAGFSDYLSAIVSLAFGIPQVIAPILSLIAAKKAKKKATEDENREDLKGVAIDGVEVMASKAVKKADDEETREIEQNSNKKVAAYTKEATAGVAKQIGKGPKGWVTAAISAAAIATILGVMIAVNVKKQEIKDQEDFDEGLELAETTKTEIDKNNEIIYSYNDIYEQYKKSGEGKDELIAKANELAKAYDNEAIAIAALNGQYDKMNSLILEESSKALDTQIKDLEKAEGLMKNQVAREIAKVDDNFNTGWSTSDETIALGVEKEFLADKNSILKDVYTSDGHKFNGDYSKPETFVAVYEEMEDMVAEASKKGATNDSELYKQWNEWLGAHKDTYEAVSSSVDTRKKANTQKTITTAKSESGANVTNASAREYDEIRGNLLDNKNLSEEEQNDIKTELANYNSALEARMQTRDKLVEWGLDKNIVTDAIYGANDMVMRAIGAINEDTALAIQNGELDLWEAIQRNLVNAAIAGRNEIWEELFKDTDAGELYTDSLAQMNEGFRNNTVALNLAATAAAKMNKALDTTLSTWKKYSGEFLTGTPGTVAWAEAVGQVTTSLKDLFGITADTDLTRVVFENKDIISDFLNGNLKQFDAIQSALGVGNAGRLGASVEFQNALANLGASKTALGAYVQQAYIDAINKTIQDSNLAEEQIIDILNQAGYDAQYSSALDGSGTIQITKLTRIISSDNSIDSTAFDKMAKDAEKAIDRLKEFEIRLERIQSLLEKIADAKDRAFGQAKLKYLQQETKQLETLLEFQKEYLEGIKNEYSRAKDKLFEYGGVKLDDNGNIINRTALLEQQAKTLGGAGSDAFSDFNDIVEEYEDILKQYQDKDIDISDLKNQIYDNKLAELIEPIELKLSFNEKDLELLEWQLENLEDQSYAAAESIEILSRQAEEQVDNYNLAQQALADSLKVNFSDSEIQQILSGNVDILNTREITEEQANYLYDYAEALRESVTALRELENAVEEQLLDDFNEFNDELSQNIELMEKATSVIENYQNIIELVGKDTLGLSNEVLIGMRDAAVTIANSQLEARKKALDANEKAYMQAKEKFEQGLISKETFEEIQDTYNTARDEFMNSWNSALEAASNAFEANVQTILNTFSDTMGGIYDSLDEMSNWYDKQKETADFYLKDYEKVYEINKLNRQIVDSINTSDNTQTQKKLNTLQKELLSYQEEGKEMSDYDLGYLQKKYELTMAQIALEEAQNNKTQVRLHRDSAGNFGYVYTADQAEIDKAEQNYEDKLYDMEKFLESSLDALTQQYINYNKQWQEELASLDKTAIDYEEKAKAITEYYSDLMRKTTGEMSDLVQYGKILNEEYGAHAAATFKDTLIGQMYTDIDTFEQLCNLSNQAMIQSLGLVQSEWTKYQANISTSMKLAGTSVEGFKTEAVKGINEVTASVDTLSTKVSGLASSFETSFNNALGKVENFKNVFKNKIGEMQSSAAALSGTINQLLKDYDPEIVDIYKSLGLGGYSGAITGLKNGGFNTIADIHGDYSYVTSARMDKTGTVANNLSIQNGSNGTIYNVAKGAAIDYTYTDGKYKITTTGINQNSNQEEKFSTILEANELEQLIGQSLITSTGSTGSYQTNYKIQAIDVDSQGYAVVKVNDKWYNSKSVNNGMGKIGDTATFINEYAYNNPVDGPSSENINFNTSYTSAKNKDIKGFKPLDSYSDKTWSGKAGKGTAYTYDYIRYPTYGTDENGKYYLFVKGSKYWYDITGQTTDPRKGFTVYSGSRRYEAFDTGGYTGEWGPEGRIAMLHQKEIVLNAHDTENFLTAIGIVRDISDQIEKNAIVMQYQNQLANYRASVGNSDKTLQQEVHITAEFPNATDHNEIEEAFRGLVDQAAQYVTTIRG